MMQACLVDGGILKDLQSRLSRHSPLIVKMQALENFINVPCSKELLANTPLQGSVVGQEGELAYMPVYVTLKI